MSQPAATSVKQDPARTYGVELFFEQLPALSSSLVLDALRRRSPDIAAGPAQAAANVLVFVHRAHLAQGVPVRLVIAAAPRQPQPDELRGALAQSWGWPEAAATLVRCGGAVLVTDVVAGSIDHRERMVLMENVLVALLEAFPAAAIHWQPAQQLVSPQQFLTAWNEAGGLVWVPGPLNVRLFPLQGADANSGAGGEGLLMDTVGLAPLGLPDLQCRFRGLDPAAVSRVLYNTAIYLGERGPVIEDGHTVPGIRPEERWRCRSARSLAPPHRLVLELIAQPPQDA